jgi:peptidoglycan hydrolase FlgJ
MSSDSTNRIALDSRALDRLRADAHADPRKALKGAATQFEAIFVNMLLKSMRESLPRDGMFNSETTRLYTGMLDQQLAQGIAAKGLGLADALVKQLERHPSVAAKTPESGPSAAPTAPAPAATDKKPAAAGEPQRESFIDRLLPYARTAAAATGIPARFMLGQAALESGWGRKEIRAADGTPTFNLFGIKAGRGWTGKTVDVLTTEYVGGVARKVVQTFRAYSSYAEAFADWGKLITRSPRYANAVAAGEDATGFARGLQAGGYATDPAYAEKLSRVLNHVLLKRTIA